MRLNFFESNSFIFYGEIWSLILHKKAILSPFAEQHLDLILKILEIKLCEDFDSSAPPVNALHPHCPLGKSSPVLGFNGWGSHINRMLCSLCSSIRDLESQLHIFQCKDHVELDGGCICKQSNYCFKSPEKGMSSWLTAGVSEVRFMALRAKCWVHVCTYTCTVCLTESGLRRHAGSSSWFSLEPWQLLYPSHALGTIRGRAVPGLVSFTRVTATHTHRHTQASHIPEKGSSAVKSCLFVSVHFSRVEKYLFVRSN